MHVTGVPKSAVTKDRLPIGEFTAVSSPKDQFAAQPLNEQSLISVGASLIFLSVTVKLDVKLLPAVFVEAMFSENAF